MKKLFSIFAALTLSVGLWAQSPGTFADLQALVTNASAGDTITLDKDYTYEETSAAADGGVSITKSLTIDLNKHTISGNEKSRCFVLTGGTQASPIQVTIKNGTLTDGYTQYNGGAIIVGRENDYVTSTIDSCTISNSISECYNTTWNGMGGGIYVGANCTCAIKSATITENSAVYGGAIENKGTCTINGVTFTNNSSSEWGGAITNEAKGACTIVDATFTENTANGDGGAIYNECACTIKDATTFTNNSAGDYGGAILNNGGILNLTTNQGKSIEITSNQAETVGSGIYTWGELNISGKVIVKDNLLTDETTHSNFSLYYETPVNIIGDMTGSNIYFELVDDDDEFTFGTLTSGYSDNSGSTALDAFFHYDGPTTIGSHNIGVTLNADGEIYVGGLYTRNSLYDGKWGTICLGYAVPSLEDVDATFYKLNYYDGASSLYVTEVTELEAGHPYVFEAKAGSFSVVYVPTDDPTVAQSVNGLIGTLTDLTTEADAYALVNNVVVKAAAGTTVPANRAYIDLMQVSPTPLDTPAGAPRRIGVAKAPTGLEQSVISNQQSAIKVLKGGQLLLIKEGKTYNTQGQILQ